MLKRVGSAKVRTVADVPVVANSHFTASVLRKRYGVEARVIYPFIKLSDYKTASTRQNVVFINPIVRKGSGLLIESLNSAPNSIYLRRRCSHYG